MFVCCLKVTDFEYVRFCFAFLVMITDSLKGIGNQSVSQQTLRQNLAEKDPMYYQTSVGGQCSAFVVVA